MSNINMENTVVMIKKDLRELNPLFKESTSSLTSADFVFAAKLNKK